MNKRNTALLFLLAAVGLAGCQAVNDGLTATNQALATLNSALGAPQGARAGVTGGAAVFVPAEVKQKTSAAITSAQAQETNRMIADARPAIENMVALVACGAESRRMVQYTDPDSSQMMYVSPLVSMNYHKSGCLNPVRVAGWQKRSANAVSFVVDYVSPQSEEGARRAYTAVKQPSGEWLFRW